ncbi:MAG: hypothetical protein IPN13_06415 [Bacteroidetes bacterium]|nr:hypothetical protein [Bacteroidota bacterium]
MDNQFKYTKKSFAAKLGGKAVVIGSLAAEPRHLQQSCVIKSFMVIEGILSSTHKRFSLLSRNQKSLILNS